MTSEAFAKALDRASHSRSAATPGTRPPPLIPRWRGPRSPEWLPWRSPAWWRAAAPVRSPFRRCSGRTTDRRPFSPERGVLRPHWDGGSHFFRPFARMWWPHRPPGAQRERARRGAGFELVHQLPRPASDDDGGDRSWACTGLPVTSSRGRWWGEDRRRQPRVPDQDSTGRSTSSFDSPAVGTRLDWRRGAAALPRSRLPRSPATAWFTSTRPPRAPPRRSRPGGKTLTRERIVS